MLCGGCGAKVSADVLNQVLRDNGVGVDSLDDAARYEPPPGVTMLHTVDALKSFVEDSYLFARIATEHALSDIYAMGGVPVNALAVISVPQGTPEAVRSTLQQVVAGVRDVLDDASVKLIGGHTTQGAELNVSLAVNGTVEAVLEKRGARPGDHLVLTKPLGTGTLFAADMQYQAKGVWIKNALRVMQQSNQKAGALLKQYGASSCTDVTGFGLAGHLSEMLGSSGYSAGLKLDAIPVLDGAVVTVNRIKSTLHEGNQRSIGATEMSSHPTFPLLFDPQTSGGLLAAVAAEDSADLVAELQTAGYESACVIGEILEMGKHTILFND